MFQNKIKLVSMLMSVNPSDLVRMSINVYINILIYNLNSSK